MAATSKLLLRNLRRTNINITRQFSKITGNVNKNSPLSFLSIVTGGIVVYAAFKFRSMGKVYAAQVKNVSVRLINLKSPCINHNQIFHILKYNIILVWSLKTTSYFWIFRQNLNFWFL